MSVNVPDAPTYADPVVVSNVLVGDHYVGKFSTNWLGWLLALNRAVQDLQASIPLSTQIFGPAPGPGPFSLPITFTTRKAAVITLFGNGVQTFTTAAPSWEMQLNIDGVVYNTGIMSSWQPVIEMVFQHSVGPGIHTASVAWASGDANATIQSLALSVFPTYTE